MSQEFVEQLVWSVVKKCAIYVKNLFKKQRETEQKQNDEETRNAIESIESNKEESSDETNPSVEDIENSSEKDKKEITENGGTEKSETDDDKSVDETEIELNKENKEEPSKEIHVEAVSLDTTIFFHFTLFLLWSLVAGLCFPSVLTWAHNFR